MRSPGSRSTCAYDLSAFRGRVVGELAGTDEGFAELERRSKVLVFREAQLR